MKKTYWKSLFRCITKNIGKFLALFGIVLISSLLISGLGTLTYTEKMGFNDLIRESNLPEIILKSKEQGGFKDDDLEMIEDTENVKDIQEVYSYDFVLNERETRVIYADYENMTIGKCFLLDGEWPSKFNEVAVERLQDNSQRKIGDTFKVGYVTYKVTGVVDNPLNFALVNDVSQSTQKDLQDIFYCYNKLGMGLLAKETFFMGPDIYITFSHENDVDYYGDAYLNSIAAIKDSLVEKIGESKAAGLTLNENVSFNYMKETFKRVDVILTMFPVIFIVVASLVSSITVDRLVSEERGFMGCFKTLGYSNLAIKFRYLFFSLASSVSGALIGMFGGIYALTPVLYPTFEAIVYEQMPMPWFFNFAFGIIGCCIIVFCVLVVTLYKVRITIRETPAETLKSKAPVNGKKILLEKIKPLWNILPFKYKATIRNIFRYKTKTATMVVSVMSSMGIVMGGFGLMDLASGGDQTLSMIDTFKQVSVFLIIFATALAILVIYNLVNINVSEREREIATLQVLGYKTVEVYAYVFREIVIMGLMGEILGIPLGVFILWILTYYMDFGHLSDVNIGSYLATLAVGVVTLVVVCFMMIPKIKKINMISSLKSLE